MQTIPSSLSDSEFITHVRWKTIARHLTVQELKEIIEELVDRLEAKETDLDNSWR